MSNKPIGRAFVGPSNALSYTDPFIEIFMDRSPTTRDINYPVQKRWLDKSTNTEYLLKGFSSSFDTEFNQTVLSAEWEAVGISNSLIKFTAGQNTSGSFPVLPNGSQEVSIGSPLNTIQITGGTSSLDFNTVANYLSTGRVNFQVPALATKNVTQLTLTTGTWIVYGLGSIGVLWQSSISTVSETINTSNYITGTVSLILQIFPLVVTVVGTANVYLVVKNLSGAPQNTQGNLTAVKLGI